MHPAEQIAKDTWGRLKQSRELRTRLGEETLTDLLVLDFVRLMDRRARLFQSTKIQESKRGTDLEIRIHAGGNRAIAFALQAKKLHRDESYRGLKTTVKSSKFLQLEVLKDYAEKVARCPTLSTVQLYVPGRVSTILELPWEPQRRSGTTGLHSGTKLGNSACGL